MRKLISIFALIVLLCTNLLCVRIAAQDFSRYMIETLEILVDRTLEAYNIEDHIKFHEYYAKQMNEITVKQYFWANFVEGYKEDFGEYLTRKLLKDKSVLDPDFPMLAYSAEFAKNKKSFIRVNFVKEYDNYRITRMRFDTVHEELGSY